MLFQIHRHSKRANHLPIQLKTESDMIEQDGSILLLKGVMSVRDGHYISISEPPGPPSSEWLHFNSTAHLKGNIFSNFIFLLMVIEILFLNNIYLI